jgi:hypothetical protein
MSRTYRKPSVLEEYSQVTYINSELKWAQYSNLYRIKFNRLRGPDRQRPLVEYDEVIKEAKQEYASFSYDGTCAETSRRSGYKNAAAKIVRRANRALEKDIVAERSYEKPYPDRYLGKTKKWDFW